MSMVYSYTPRETETGPAGEHPVKGYRGQAHQTMRSVLRTGGRDVQLASRPYPSTHRMIDLSCLNKTHLRTAGCPRKPVSRKPGAPHRFQAPLKSAITMAHSKKSMTVEPVKKPGFIAIMQHGVKRIVPLRISL